MRRLVWFGALVAMTLVPAGAKADEACWNALDAAIAHRAAAAVPAYVRYSVRRSIALRDNYPLVSDQPIVYRSADGAARVADSLFGGSPSYTFDLQPGPPFVGPSGENRSGWNETDTGGVAIAVVHAHAGKACDDLGRETVGGRVAEHLRVTPHRENAPGIRDLWVDAHSEIWRAVVAQYLDGETIAGVRGAILLECTIDVREDQGQAVVASVRFSDRGLGVDGSYVFSGYAYSAAPPTGTFPP